MEPLLVYHHIQKTAGASLRIVVKDNYAPERILESYGAASDNEWYRLWWESFTAQEASAIQCVAGHSANHLLPALDRPFRVLSLLRDPVERVVSLYHYLLGRHEYMKARAPGGGREKRLGVGLLDEEAWTLDDIYRRLGDGDEGRSAPHDLLSTFFNGQMRTILRPHSHLATLAYAEGSWPEGQLHLQSALEYMTRHYVVGLQDDLAHSIDRFAQEFGWQSVFTPHVNVTQREGRHEVSDETRTLIRRYNALDIELYEHFREALGDGAAGPAGPTPNGGARGATPPSTGQADAAAERRRAPEQPGRSSPTTPHAEALAEEPAQDEGRGPPSQTTEQQLLDLQQQIEQVLEAALSREVMSESPHQSTGNAYQTVRLGDGGRAGFRSVRENLLAGFEVDGRAVCDLGANLGEIARDLRRAGASQVDAYEYDSFFTQLARYLTAHSGLTDVSHFQADVAEPGFMRRRYDIGVGLSAFSFMRTNIDYICEQVSELMIVETHEVRDESWHARYVRRIDKHLPHWCCFGRVTHGGAESGKRRLWLAFARDDLAGFYERRARTVLPDGEGVVDIDLTKSRIPFFAKAGLAAEQRDDPLSKESYRLYSDRLAEHEARFAAGESVDLSMSGEAYWLSFLCGIVELDAEGGLAESNVYARWMTRGLEAGAPGLRYLMDDRRALQERLSIRLTVLGKALRERDASQLPDVPVIYNATPSHPELERLNFKTFAVHGSEERLSVPRFDGHHRLFVLNLLGIERCPMMTIWDPGTLGRPKSLQRVRNYEQRMYQYLAGVDVDDPVVAAPGAVQPLR